MRTFIIAAATLLALSAGALAQGHSHGTDRKGPHGGSIQDVADVEAELVVAEKMLTIYLYDEAGKPVPASGYSSSALVGTGPGRQVVQLTPGDGNTLSGTAAAAVGRDTPMTLQLKAPGGKTGQARF